MILKKLKKNQAKLKLAMQNLKLNINSSKELINKILNN